MKVFFTISFALVLRCTFAQSYESYYLQCNSADSLKYVGKNDEALKMYKTAFQSVDFVHSDKLIKAYRLAIEMKLFHDAGIFGRSIIVNSGKTELIKTNSSEFKKSIDYKNLLDSSRYFLVEFNQRINHQYIKIIDSLVFIDQYIIRKNKSYKDNYAIDKSKLPVNIFDLDSSNWQFLYTCIKKWGFPSEENVGHDHYCKAWAILHHNLRLVQNEKYHREIVEYIKNGSYLPEDMMVWYEQFQQQNYGTTFFTTWDGNLTSENLMRINKNRVAFSLKRLDAYELRKNGRYMELKW